MEKTSTNTLSPCFSLSGLVGFLLFHGILKWVTKIQKFYSSFLCFYGKSKSRPERRNVNSEVLNQKLSICEKEEDDGKLSREDVEIVMGEIKLICNPDSEKIQERLGLDDLLVLFEEKEPSVDEVKGAFDVFDENRDGFVDATELQKVLCTLGFREGSKMEDCERMIRTFDENRDGLIDFNEFVKLMENSFC
ncbi:EF-hand domain [Macleaya cordata]|uniref:EF-hand domain n=1 Tax=Macleaya cordata TaxID=56857 RepID=A0A200QH43_MACCD|nr:EF-hand domain [Macleaya cordata]